jgi:hypothetical protein
LAKSKYDIQVLQSGLLSEYKNPEEIILGFLDPNRVGRAFALSDWTVEDEIAELIEMVRDPATGEKTKLQAMGYLRKLVKNSALLGGLLKKTEISGTNEEGVHFKVSEIKRALDEFHEDPHTKQLPNDKYLPNDDDKNQVHRPPQEITDADYEEETSG